MKHTFRHIGIILVLALLLTPALACAPTTPTPTPSAFKGPVTIASKIDTEGELLAEIIKAMLIGNRFQTVDKSGLGPTQIVRAALLSGEIDIYPEYTGNGAFFFSSANVDPAVWRDAKKAWETVSKLDKDANKVVWLESAPANNTWAIAVPKALAEKEKLKSLDDFAAYVNRGGYVKLAGSEEFVTSPVALPAFQKAYGFTLKQDQLVTLSGGNTATTEKAAAEGTSGVNAAMAYGTDGSLAALNLVILTDPKGAQPVYEPAPIVRGAVFDKYPELTTILNPVFRTLTMEVLQDLNSRIAIQGQAAERVANVYLWATTGLLK